MSILFDSSMALSFEDPEPIRMASNSESESDRIPDVSAFSLGLSASAKSLIENVFIMHSFEVKKSKVHPEWCLKIRKKI
jgi:hypothetical protein